MKNLILIIIFLISSISCNSWNMYKEKDKEINSTVTKKYIGEFSHQSWEVDLNDGSNFILDNYVKNYYSVYDYIDIGDSLIKKKGYYSLFVIKPNRKKVEFFYCDDNYEVYDNNGKKLYKLTESQRIINNSSPQNW